MLMDSQLLPVYRKAVANEPKAILKMADAYRFGEGVPKNGKEANQWYEKLIHFDDLPFVDYEYCYFIAGDAAYDRQDYRLAYERYNLSLRLFVQKFGVPAALDKLSEFNFFDSYYHVKVLAEANC